MQRASAWVLPMAVLLTVGCADTEPPVSLGGDDDIGGEGEGEGDAGADAAVEQAAWTPTALAGAPTPRIIDTGAVWTGAEMVVWGGMGGVGETDSCAVGDGARYDPVADAWRPIESDGAPGPQEGHLLAWTGTEVLVWGGFNSRDAIKKGCPQLDPATPGRYRPDLDRWSTMNEEGGPGVRANFAWAWTGSRLIVWGGQAVTYLSDGALYDPVADRWSPMASDGAPSPRRDCAFAWTGSRLLVWGGFDSHGIQGALYDGGFYDPATDEWSPIHADGSPSVAVYRGHSVWTGTRWLVWGWTFGEDVFVGRSYDPETDTWEVTSSDGAPQPDEGARAIWTGTEVVFWGGASVGARYSPVQDRWQTVTTLGEPERRYGHATVWTEEEMIVWGGNGVTSDPPLLATGGRYRPSLD